MRRAIRRLKRRFFHYFYKVPATPVVWSALAVLASFILVMGGLRVEQSLDRYHAALKQREFNTATNKLAAGLAEILLERLAINNALQAEGPASIGELRMLTARRNAVIGLFDAGLAEVLTFDFPQKDRLLDDLRKNLAAAEAARGRAYQAVLDPKYARDEELLRTFVPVVAASVNSALALWLSGLQAAAATDPELMRLALVKELAWRLRIHAGLERSMIASTLASGSAITRDLYNEMTRERARSVLLWDQLLVQTGEAEPHATLRQAVVAAQRSYLNDFHKLADALLAGEPPYSTTAQDLVTRTNPMLRSLLNIVDAAVGASDRVTFQRLEEARWNLRRCLMGMGIGLSLAMFCGWMVHYRLTRPVAEISRALVALSKGDSTVSLPVYVGGDEMAAMSKALHGYKSSLDEAIRLRETEREAVQLRVLARTDTLSGIANRFALLERLDDLTRCQDTQCSFALALFDLDGFKEINDAFGHYFGDRALIAFVQTLKSFASPSDFVARLGGDEFALILAGEGWQDRLQRLTHHGAILLADQSLELDGKVLRLSSSAGVAVFPDHGSSGRELLANADLALCKAKADHMTCMLFDWPMRQERDRHRVLEAELRAASQRGEFVLFYQPQYDLGTRQLVGVEALIRWQHPTRGVLGPGEFLDVIHASDFANEVAVSVLRMAMEQAARWERLGTPLRVAINLSPCLFRLDLAGLLSRELARAGVCAHLIELEITENILLLQEQRVSRILEEIRRLGVTVAFDDFGTGYASLTHLRDFPIDVIKIDRSFTSDIVTDVQSQAIVRGVVAMAAAFEMRVVAEGVETEEAARMIASIGCHEGQGYHYGRPRPAADLEIRMPSGRHVA